MTITTEELTDIIDLLREKDEKQEYLEQKLRRIEEEYFRLRIEYDKRKRQTIRLINKQPLTEQ